ncbi:POU domain, class 3, transcription factor 2-like [Portunus trituberculatus]|uniref:POU domain, class 3, transcription factor 2-like n=1 Tax=Portunus trituberculatus TaxID=210409 RepID=UPI001E1CE22C|nr:POU domain, class 3, transcription factor 2-like [Portunus trituberculatus]
MAWSRSGNGDWRQQIYNNLRERNKREYENITDLIQLHTRLFEQSETLKAEILQLTIQNEKLQQSNLQLLSCGSGSGSGGGGGGGNGGGGGGEGGGTASPSVVQVRLCQDCLLPFLSL